MLEAKIPKDSRYPKALETIGDHLRTIRLDRNLEMSEVASILDVSVTSIYDWEHNRKHPNFSYHSSIVAFLGYEPKEILNNRMFIENFERFRKKKQLTVYHCATRMGMCSKQLKKLINNEMELSELNRSRIEYFLSN